MDEKDEEGETLKLSGNSVVIDLNDKDEDCSSNVTRMFEPKGSGRIPDQRFWWYEMGDTYKIVDELADRSVWLRDPAKFFCETLEHGDDCFKPGTQRFYEALTALCANETDCSDVFEDELKAQKEDRWAPTDEDVVEGVARFQESDYAEDMREFNAMVEGAMATRLHESVRDVALARLLTDLVVLRAKGMAIELVRSDRDAAISGGLLLCKSAGRLFENKEIFDRCLMPKVMELPEALMYPVLATVVRELTEWLRTEALLLMSLLPGE